ncbi:hypothetical protein E2C01_034194 [Portunus trituberculatus]|uniref:Uncharacterized protein n=1 Tax=Portunus trituberculatus TaxID=210409 RepID=A0A5B7F0U2_PORTR|nr:hypothetical protein [Portunus trituberculatus]
MEWISSGPFARNLTWIREKFNMCPSVEARETIAIIEMSTFYSWWNRKFLLCEILCKILSSKNSWKLQIRYVSNAASC